MKVIPIKTRIFKEGEALAGFILSYIPRLKEGSVLVITSKIVALAQNRTAEIGNARAKDDIIRAESEFAIKTKYCWLTIKDGIVLASAGVDESNANGKLILLPKDSFKIALLLRKKLRQKYGVKKLGIVITDSRTIPLRAGITGVALGYAGFRGVKDYRGMPDIFGRKFKFSRVDMADGLASAAVLVMGEGSERIPLAIIENAPIEFCDRTNREELHIDIKDDMYRPLFSRLPKSKS